MMCGAIVQVREDHIDYRHHGKVLISTMYHELRIVTMTTYDVTATPHKIIIGRMDLSLFLDKLYFVSMCTCGGHRAGLQMKALPNNNADPCQLATCTSIERSLAHTTARRLKQ
jgi:hypothetical protein